MRKSFFSSVFELLGFATVGMIFFVWFLGNRGSNLLPETEMHASGALQSRIGDNLRDDSAGDLGGYALEDPGYNKNRTRSNSGFEKKSSFKSPRPVSGNSLESGSSTTRSSSANRSGTEERAGEATRQAEVVRNWKGLHRDESYAWNCYQRFGDEVARLSDEYGLYPEVFMARVITYSYDYVTDPRQDPADHNFTALKRPGDKNRAYFKNAEESLKAYAVVNAGEVSRLSVEGALAKHDRAWTLTKVIEDYAFVSDMAETAAAKGSYRGSVGPANDVSEEENYQREIVGETIRLATRVDKTVKERRAKDAGYDSWEDYLEGLPEGQRQKQQEEAAAVTSAVTQKKAMNLTRRVNAKKQNKKERSTEIVLNQDKD